jgi:hypothetical protein
MEWQKYQKLGELGYEAERKQRSLEYLHAQPYHFAWMTARRTAYIWTGFWSFSRKFLEDEPTAIPNLFICTGLTVFMLLGLRALRRNRSPAAWAYAWLLLTFFPVYYITHIKMDFRHPVEPMIVVLVVYAFTYKLEAEPASRDSAEAPQGQMAEQPSVR